MQELVDVFDSDKDGVPRPEIGHSKKLVLQAGVAPLIDSVPDAEVRSMLQQSIDAMIDGEVMLRNRVKDDQNGRYEPPF